MLLASNCHIDFTLAFYYTWALFKTYCMSRGLYSMQGLYGYPFMYVVSLFEHVMKTEILQTHISRDQRMLSIITYLSLLVAMTITFGLCPSL